jgi:hypothetical protein
LATLATVHDTARQNFAATSSVGRWCDMLISPTSLGSRENLEVTPSGAVTVGLSAVLRIRPAAENRPAIQRRNRNESGAPIELASAFAAGTTGRRHHGAFGPTSMWRLITSNRDPWGWYQVLPHC